MHPRLSIAVACLIAATVAPVTASADAERGGGPCTIFGTTGADRIVGTPGDDVICASYGDDVVVAGGGNDVVHGGRGADRILGGRGHDRLVGDAGADRLYGGRGGDDLDDRHSSNESYGGPGVDTCPGRARVRSSCVREDRRAPWFTDVTLSSPSVDVSENDAVVTLTVHARDDSGVRYVGHRFVSDSSVLLPDTHGGTRMRLVSGVTRDGLWRAQVRVPRGQRPGDYAVRLRLHDRTGKGQWEIPTETVLHVANTNPDETAPTVTAMVKPVDEPTVAVNDTLRIRIRATDDRCGVALVWFGYQYLDDAAPRTDWRPGIGELVDGTMMDGAWVADVPLYTDPAVPSGPGVANIVIQVTDRCWNTSMWFGPDLYAELEDDEPLPPAELGEYPIPGGRGRFTVV